MANGYYNSKNRKNYLNKDKKDLVELDYDEEYEKAEIRFDYTEKEMEELPLAKLIRNQEFVHEPYRVSTEAQRALVEKQAKERNERVDIKSAMDFYACRSYLNSNAYFMDTHLTNSLKKASQTVKVKHNPYDNELNSIEEVQILDEHKPYQKMTNQEYNKAYKRKAPSMAEIAEIEKENERQTELNRKILDQRKAKLNSDPNFQKTYLEHDAQNSSDDKMLSEILHGRNDLYNAFKDHQHSHFEVNGIATTAHNYKTHLITQEWGFESVDSFHEYNNKMMSNYDEILNDIDLRSFENLNQHHIDGAISDKLNNLKPYEKAHNEMIRDVEQKMFIYMSDSKTAEHKVDLVNSYRQLRLYEIKNEIYPEIEAAAHIEVNKEVSEKENILNMLHRNMKYSKQLQEQQGEAYTIDTKCVFTDDNYSMQGYQFKLKNQNGDVLGVYYESSPKLSKAARVHMQEQIAKDANIDKSLISFSNYGSLDEMPKIVINQLEKDENTMENTTEKAQSVSLNTNEQKILNQVQQLRDTHKNLDNYDFAETVSKEIYNQDYFKENKKYSESFYNQLKSQDIPFWSANDYQEKNTNDIATLRGVMSVYQKVRDLSQMQQENSVTAYLSERSKEVSLGNNIFEHLDTYKIPNLGKDGVEQFKKEESVLTLLHKNTQESVTKGEPGFYTQLSNVEIMEKEGVFNERFVEKAKQNHIPSLEYKEYKAIQKYQELKTQNQQKAASSIQDIDKQIEQENNSSGRTLKH